MLKLISDRALQLVQMRAQMDVGWTGHIYAGAHTIEMLLIQIKEELLREYHAERERFAREENRRRFGADPD